MADEIFALSTVPEPPAEAEYLAICAAVMTTRRGRWFLQEYLRRNRGSDIQTVLAAIERIESVIHGEQAHQAQQQHRLELLEMARTIAQTRAEVADLKPDPTAVASEKAADETTSEVVAAAQRLQDVAWTMREQGIDPSTSDQIEQLATTILSASSLRNPDDRRAQKLAEVLQYLERRIDTMLNTSPDRVPEGAKALIATEAEREGAGHGDADAQPSAEPVAAMAEVAAAELPDDEPLQIESGPLLPAEGAAAYPTPTTLDVPPLTVETAARGLDAVTDEPALDGSQELPSPPQDRPPEASASEQSPAILETPLEAESTVAAEVDADLGFLTAPVVAAAEATAVTQDREERLSGPAEPTAATEVPHKPDMLTSAFEAASSGGDGATPAPSMWDDRQPGSAPAAAPLPADFLLHPLSSPGKTSVAPPAGTHALPAAQSSPEAVEDELFAEPTEPTSPLEHGPEKACPGPDPGWEPLFAKDQAERSKGDEFDLTQLDQALAAPAPRPAAPPMPLPGANDPLAALRAMSEEERVALFT